jgi:hypothetical protein
MISLFRICTSPTISSRRSATRAYARASSVIESPLDVDVLVNDIWGGRPNHRLGSPVYGLTDVDGSQPDFWAYLHAFLAERGQTFSEWVEQMDLS